MPGPAPNPARRGRNKLARGNWKPAEGEGWQYGDTPQPPDGLLAVSIKAWAVWFGSWFAVNWRPDDLPGLELVILQYDKVRRGNSKAADENALHVGMRAYGITPDGQLALRWARPKAPEVPQEAPEATADDPYGHLRVVNA